MARHVAERRRVYAQGNASRAGQDPQILQVVGKVRGAAYSTGAIALKAAEALQRSYEANVGPDASIREAANLQADLEVSQSVTVVTSLVLDATTVLFDALGASAAKRSNGLDRHWRNVRTISSHNPRIYHDRTVGHFAVHGSVPPRAIGIGIAKDPKDAADSPKGAQFAS